MEKLHYAQCTFKGGLMKFNTFWNDFLSQC